MVVLSLKSKRDKEKLLEKARKMEEYSSMIVDCLEESMYDDSDEDYEESYRNYKRSDEMAPIRNSRYNYRRM
jgi:hypothetical protein